MLAFVIPNDLSRFKRSGEYKKRIATASRAGRQKNNKETKNCISTYVTKR